MAKRTTTYETIITEQGGHFFASVIRRRSIGATQKTDSISGGSGSTREAAQGAADKMIAHLRTREA